MSPVVANYRGQTYAQEYPGRSATMDDSLNGMGYVEPHSHPCACQVATSGIDVLGIQIPTWAIVAGIGWYLFRDVAKHQISRLGKKSA